MMYPIADFLPVFGPGRGAVAMAIAAEVGEIADTVETEGAGFEDAVGMPEPVPAGIPAEEVERRVAEARTEVQIEAAAALEAAMAELEARHAETLAEERRRWAEEQGAVLAEMLKAGLEDIETRLAESVVVVLEPFVEAAMRVKAVTELRAAVADLLAHGRGAAVRVRGPLDLLAPLEAAFAGREGLAFEPADAVDVTIESEDTTIRSQVGAWAEALHTYLHEVNT